jgi:hypothetical protein
MAIIMIIEHVVMVLAISAGIFASRNPAAFSSLRDIEKYLRFLFLPFGRFKLSHLFFVRNSFVDRLVEII